MKKSIKVLIVVVALFAFLAVSVGAYYAKGWYNCAGWMTCGRYNAAGTKVGKYWNGSHVEIKSIKVMEITKTTWWGRTYQVNTTMGLSYLFHQPNSWVIMSEWRVAEGH